MGSGRRLDPWPDYWTYRLPGSLPANANDLGEINNDCDGDNDALYSDYDRNGAAPVISTLSAVLIPMALNARPLVKSDPFSSLRPPFIIVIIPF